MIISASRRTDIPSFYADWFFSRLKERVVFVRNPVNKHQISKISLQPDLVDGFVFWTKDPSPMIGNLSSLSEWPFYFQFTLTAYQNDIEKGLPSKARHIIPIFQHLSDLIGPYRVLWRYDPILINDKYNLDYHLLFFERLAKRLSGFALKSIVSFYDPYPSILGRTNALKIKTLQEEKKIFLIKHLAAIAASYGFTLEVCAEDIPLNMCAAKPAKCIDAALLEKISTVPLSVAKDKNQRSFCGCAQAIDIGAYDTCFHDCLYCYAGHNRKKLQAHRLSYDPSSPLLDGTIGDKDILTERKMTSCRDTRQDLLSYSCFY